MAVLKICLRNGLARSPTDLAHFPFDLNPGRPCLKSYMAMWLKLPEGRRVWLCSKVYGQKK